MRDEAHVAATTPTSTTATPRASSAPHSSRAPRAVTPTLRSGAPRGPTAPRAPAASPPTVLATVAACDDTLTGFEVVARILRRVLFSLEKRVHASPDHSIGLAILHLKTSYRSSVKKKREAVPTRRPGALTRSLSPVPSRSQPSAAITPSPHPASEGVPLEEADRLDMVFDERSSQDQGMRRLKMLECLQLCPGDEVTVVVPPWLASSKAPSAARAPRKRILSDFQRLVLSSADACLSCPDNRDLFLKNERHHRTIFQSGHEHVEFNVVKY